MLAGHMDTARTTGYPEAYTVKVADGKMHGRGACDMKAALAAYLGVVKALKETGTRLKGRLIVCGIVDEEYQMLGSKAIGRSGRMADQGIIGEPTNLRVCPSNKGRVSTKIVTRGRADQRARRVNAIERWRIDSRRLQPGAARPRPAPAVRPRSVHAGGDPRRGAGEHGARHLRARGGPPDPAGRNP
jgi:hypothetical protein